MPKLESLLENVTYEIICDFEIITDHLIPARRLDVEENTILWILSFQRTTEWK